MNKYLEKIAGKMTSQEKDFVRKEVSHTRGIISRTEPSDLVGRGASGMDDFHRRMSKGLGKVKNLPQHPASVQAGSTLRASSVAHRIAASDHGKAIKAFLKLKK